MILWHRLPIFAVPTPFSHQPSPVRFSVATTSWSAPDKVTRTCDRRSPVLPLLDHRTEDTVSTMNDSFLELLSSLAMAVNIFCGLTFHLVSRPQNPNVIFVTSTWISTIYLKLNMAKTEPLIQLYLKNIYMCIHKHT